LKGVILSIALGIEIQLLSPSLQLWELFSATLGIEIPLPSPSLQIWELLEIHALCQKFQRPQKYQQCPTRTLEHANLPIEKRINQRTKKIEKESAL
jgi:hypothetical protein